MVLFGKLAQSFVDTHLRFVTADGAPDRVRHRLCLDDGRDRPVGPGCGLTFHPVYGDDKLLESGLIGVPLGATPCHVVELGHAVGRFPRGGRVPPCCSEYGRSRQLRDRDVIGVAVGALGAERGYYLGSYPSDMAGDLFLGFDRVWA